MSLTYEKILQLISLKFQVLTPNQKRFLKYALITGAFGSSAFLLFKYLNEKQQVNKVDPLLLSEVISDDTSNSDLLLTKKKSNNKIDSKFLGRLKLLLSLCVPRLRSKETYQLIALVIVVICRTFVSNKLSELSGDLSKVLLERDYNEFIRLLYVSTGVSVLSSILAPLLQYLIDKSTVFWRRNLTEHLNSRYLSEKRYYKAAYLSDTIKNPEQIVTQDVEKFCSGMCGLFANFVKPVADLSLYATTLIRMTGWVGPITILGYMISSWMFISFIRPNFSDLTSNEQNLEGNYRFCHVRTATHGESIAFYGGDALEKAQADKSFSSIIEQKTLMNSLKRNFEFFNQFFVIDFPQSICWILSAYPVFSGHMDEQSTGVLARDLRYLAAVISHVFTAIGELVRVHTRLSEISGHANNICQLMDTMNDFDKLPAMGFIEGQHIKFEHVNLLTPTGKPLISDINLEIQPGKNYLITGPNGSGKSGLFKLLAGLWTMKDDVGKIYRPKDFLKEFYYVPQYPYNVTGTLREQITYPLLNQSHIGDDKIRELLRMVDIEKIIDREGLDIVKNWDDILSLGEQQRLSIARLFYHHPKYAILDECTSAVSVDVEANIYKTCRELGMTTITISLRQFKFEKLFDDTITYVIENNTLKLARDNVDSYE